MKQSTPNLATQKLNRQQATTVISSAPEVNTFRAVASTHQTARNISGRCFNLFASACRFFLPPWQNERSVLRPPHSLAADLWEAGRWALLAAVLGTIYLALLMPTLPDIDPQPTPGNQVSRYSFSQAIRETTVPTAADS